MIASVRAALPSGTVTFVFTDVEGSTRLLRELGDTGYAKDLALHRRVIREACAAEGGVEVDTQGDAFFVAFPTATGALAAARTFTEALAGGRVLVRVGLHTGTPLLTEEGYIGRDVHRAARIAAAGHGGQVLVSTSTAALVESPDSSSHGAALRDLGLHRLKDLSAPERIYQLGAGDFPPLRSLYRTNLPIPATPFLGRHDELAQALALLSGRDVRLLTLTGPGGTGKTRLALQVAAEAAEHYPDGVFWVPLAPLRDSELALEAAAQALGARDDLVAYIADKSLLLLFDNFEHVIDAAVALPPLLAACPNVQLLVTSRELLRLPGEQAYSVPPLVQKDGTDLFATRARAVFPDFVASDAVPELCARLDNLPLAIELAAARVSVVSPEQLLERLSQRLDLLKAGRGVDPRQQTLRAAIEWSHELLDPQEQGLFARLAVFEGGCTLEAAEEVAGAELDILQSLGDKSLVRRTQDRFWMLETIRAYASERLEGSGEATELRRRHVEYFLTLVERAGRELEGPDQGAWFARLAAEQDNLRAALVRSSEAGMAETALRLAAALWRFWWMGGALAEGRRWYDHLLTLAPAAAASVRARALYGWGNLAHSAGALEEAQHRWEHALELYRLAGDDDGIVRALYDLGSAHGHQGRTDEAERLYEEALELARATGNLRGEAITLGNLAYHALCQGDIQRAATLGEEALALDRRRGDDYAVAVGLENLALVDLRDGRLERALERLAESLRLSLELQDNVTTGNTLAALAALALAAGDPEAAARVLGAGAQLRETLGLTLDLIESELHQQAEDGARTRLGDDAFVAAFDNGRTLSPQDALAVALRAGPGL